MFLDLHLDRADRIRAAGQDVPGFHILVADAARMHHVNFTGNLLHLAGATDAEGAARRNVEPGILGDRQHGVRFRTPGGNLRVGEHDLGLDIVLRHHVIEFGELFLEELVEFF